MANDYEVFYSETELKSTNAEVKDNVAEQQESMTKNPQYKVIVPQYMYKPAWGFPRYQALGLLKQLGKNVYASSIFKSVKDIILDTEWNIKPKQGVEVTPELQKKIDKYRLFFEKPNPEETFPIFVKKVLDDNFKYDSGIINKVFNVLGEFIQMRAAPGDTFKKNPNKHGYMDERDEIIMDKQPNNALVQAAKNPRNLDNGFVQSTAFQFYTQFIDRAAYFQFVNSVASQIPIPFGKREICWLSMNPSTDNVYSNGAALEDSVDIVLTLVYGSKFNLDFYANGNTPEGIINAVGATKKDLKKIKGQLDHSISTPRDQFGMKRRVGYRMPVVNMDNLEFVKLNLSSQEMEILNQQQWFTKILWMRFGLNADEMGFTENSNRATSTQQSKNAIRKAIKPYYTMLEDCFTHEILTEFEDGELLQFEFDFYDPAEQKEVRDLQEQEINMGINSAKNIMEDEGIDFKKIEADNQEKAEFSMNIDNSEVSSFNNDNQTDDDSQQKKDEVNLKKEKTEAKSMTAGIGGEGTTDNVMNPTGLRTISKKGDAWQVKCEGKTLGSYKSKDEAIASLSESNHAGSKDTPTEVKAEDKGEVFESPLERVTKTFMEKVDIRTKEIQKEAKEE